MQKNGALTEKALSLAPSAVWTWTTAATGYVGGAVCVHMIDKAEGGILTKYKKSILYII
jgi:hypothetical protein